jgi:hypothetical protein
MLASLSAMSSGITATPKPKLERIRKLLDEKGFDDPISSIGEYLEVARSTSDRWQMEDWKELECDDGLVLNNARIVGQVWFRGHADWNLSLQPGLYRPGRRAALAKQTGSPVPTDHVDDHLFDELFDLEHELRIDFTSYGHLLNEVNQAKTPIDWYFLMQHHGLPTRLLDWTTNALAALFFALDGYQQTKVASTGATSTADVAVWMVDAYWFADLLSSEWSSPLLAWSTDAERYVPPLETLIEKMDDSKALLPGHAMPIEPPAMHPRVAAQEGRFIIFGRTQDLLDEQVRLELKGDGSAIEELRLAQIQFKVSDVDALLRDLAQLGVSRRTLFPDLAGLADFLKWKHFHQLRGYKASC